MVDAALEERRRERKEYIRVQKRAIQKENRIRNGGNLREDWRLKKQPPGGVSSANPKLPLKRQIVWTNHDVGLFVAVAWKIGVPESSIFGPSLQKMKAFYAELCPPFRKQDVRRMISTLKASGAIEDMAFLRYLSDPELDRLVPAWVADDIRKQR